MSDNSSELNKVNPTRKKRNSKRDVYREQNDSESNARSVDQTVTSEGLLSDRQALNNNKNESSMMTFSQVSLNSTPKVKSSKRNNNNEKQRNPTTPIFRVSKSGHHQGSSTMSPSSSKKQKMTSNRNNKEFLNVVFSSPSVENNKSSLVTPNKSLMSIGDRKKLNYSPFNISGSNSLQSKRQPLQFLVKDSSSNSSHNNNNENALDLPTRYKEFWSPSPKKKWTSFQPDGLSDFIQGALYDIQHQVAGYEIKIDKDHSTINDNSNNNNNNNAPFSSTANRIIKVEKCVRLNRFCYRMLVTDITNQDKTTKNTIVLVDTMASKQERNRRNNKKSYTKSNEKNLFETGDRVIIGKTFYELDGLKYFIHWKKLED